MLFSTLVFLYFFLPLVLLAYYVLPRGWRNHVLLAASILFYTMGQAKYLPLLLGNAFLNYIMSLWIDRKRGTPWAKGLLAAAVAINLGILGVYKYTDFFLGIVNSLLGTSIPMTRLPLPLGISFFTFQAMSYTIDVYRRDVPVTRNYFTFATFVSFFPQLIAGPIVRYRDLYEELMDRRHSVQDVAQGFGRFLCGLGKKVLLADQLGQLVALQSTLPQSVLLGWLMALAYMLQLYLDFSAYSDMAIGLGRMFGFHFPENFRHPLCSASIQEFWRRWHITLGSWFRDYLYIPLGGSRVNQKWKLWRNIAIVWLLTGLWHGANWNFILWGGMYGLFLGLERMLPKGTMERIPRVIRHAWVLLVTVLGFTLFASTGLGDAAQRVGALFGLTGIPLHTVEALFYLRNYAGLLLVGAVASTPLPANLYHRLQQGKRTADAMAWITCIGCVLVLLACTAFLVDGSFSPFLYYNF